MSSNAKKTFRSVQNSFNTVKSLPRGIWAVSISMMLIAISTSMTYSVSPKFVTSVLGLSLASMGALEGISEALSQFSKLASGYSGDFFKRKKPPLMIGVILATISKPLFIIASGVGMVGTSKMIERISNGIMAVPRDAYCAQECHISKRGASLGFMMSLKTFGCVLGSLLVAGLAYFTTNYRLLLWVGFIPCFLSVFVLMKYMKEKSPEKQVSPQTQARQKIKWKDFRSLSKGYWTITLTATLFMCARFSDGFLILRMGELGAPEPLCFATIGIFNFISALCCLPLGSLSDRFNRSRMLYFSFIALALANLCFLVSGGLFWALIGVLLWGAQRGTSQMLFSAIIADEVPKKIMGTALGMFYVLSGVVAIASGLIAGKVADVSLHYAFVFGLCASLIALIALIIRNEVMIKRTNNTTRPHSHRPMDAGDTKTATPIPV